MLKICSCGWKNKGEIFRHETSRASSKGEGQLSLEHDVLQRKAGALRKRPSVPHCNSSQPLAEQETSLY